MNIRKCQLSSPKSYLCMTSIRTAKAKVENATQPSEEFHAAYNNTNPK